MGDILKNMFMKGIELLATPGCKLAELVNPFDSGHLGDRSKYFGASEMSSECQLKPVLERLHGKKPFELKTQIVMAIGHMLEVVVYLIFAAQGKKPQREVALYHPDLPWCRATVDFLWQTASGAKFLELKSGKGCPDEIRTSHFNQIMLQMGLWLLNNPGKKVSGIVMVIDRVCGDIREYPVEYDHDLFQALVERAKASWAAINGTGEMPEPSPNGLCAFCSHRDKCPAGQPKGDELPLEIAEAVETLFRANKEAREAKAKADTAKATIMGYAGGNRLKGHTGSYQLSLYYKPGRSSFNQEAIKAAMLERFSPEEIDTIYGNAVKTGSPSATVEVKAL